MAEGELPAGWAWSTLRDLGDWSGGGTPSKANPLFWNDGAIPWVSPKDMKADRIRSAEDKITAAAVDQSAAKRIPIGSVLMVTRSGILAHTFPVAVSEVEVTVNQDLKTLTPYDMVDADYIAWLLRSKNREILSRCGKHGTTVASIDTDRLKNLAIPIAPLAEQQRIVEKIETLFAELDKGEEALRAVQKLLARYRQSVLKAAVTGTLTADWRAANPASETGHDLLARILEARRKNWKARGKYSDPVSPDTHGLPELPDGWAWASLDQLVGHLTSGSRDWKQYYGRGYGTFIMAQNVRPMRFDLSQRFSVDPPPASPDAVRSQVALDDLLITIVGANTGDVCRFPFDKSDHYVCQSVALMRPVSTVLSPFIEFFLCAKGGGRDQLEKHIYGAGRPHLSFEQLRSIAIPLPPSDERVELMRLASEALAHIARVEALCGSEAKRSAALRQSILKDAFSGKLVPQDPSDEPASKLLERIRASSAGKARRKARGSVR